MYVDNDPLSLIEFIGGYCYYFNVLELALTRSSALDAIGSAGS